MKKFIYVDNAGTTQVYPEVKQAMLPFLEDFYGNPSSLHTLGQLAKEKLEEARHIVAKNLNAEDNEIYFTSGGSESDNMAINMACELGKIKGKMHIVSTKFEHHAVLHTLQNLEKKGFEVTYLDVYENGIVKLEDVKNAIKENTCLVTIMFANNEIGSIQPIKEISEICKQKGVLFHTDAVQAVGHIKIDVKDLGVDMLSLSGHKFHGPKGVGALFVKRGVRISNLIFGGAQERGKRAGTENLAGIYGMAVALDIATKNLNFNCEKMTKLRDKLIENLCKIPHSKLNGDKINRLCNNVNMCFEGIEGESLLLLLDDKGICASSGSACTSGSLDPSHVLLAIGLPHDIAHGSLRLTLSEFNTEQEIDKIIEEVPKVVDYLRKMSPVWDKLVKGELKHVI